ncbi:MAG: hypothetical protein HRU25_04265 [Psychrobium sp.]|nr:hypothetical protein [Psychrobium sp.]
MSFIAIVLLLVIIYGITITQMNKQSLTAQAFVTEDVGQFIDVSAIKSHAQRSALLVLQIYPPKNG